MLAYICEDILLNTNEIHSIRVQKLRDDSGMWELDLVRVDGKPHPSLAVFKSEGEAQKALKEIRDNLSKVNCAVDIVTPVKR